MCIRFFLPHQQSKDFACLHAIRLLAVAVFIICQRDTYVAVADLVQDKNVLAYINKAQKEALMSCQSSRKDQFNKAKPIPPDNPDGTIPDAKKFGKVFDFSNKPSAFILRASCVAKVRDILIERFGITSVQLNDILKRAGITSLLNPSTQVPKFGPTADPLGCPFMAPNCFGYETQRSFDGMCNNLIRSMRGRAFTPYVRLLEPQYADGYSTPRVSKSSQPLPSAREVSYTLFEDKEDPVDYSLLFVYTGQLIAHDIMMTAPALLENPDDPYNPELREVDCGLDGCNTTDGNEVCFPIEIPSSDPIYKNQKCLPFKRSGQVPSLDCSTDHADQLNQVTHLLDGSVIYGSSQNESNSIRDWSDTARGRLLLTPHPQGSAYKPMLPKNPSQQFTATQFSSYCFRAGDVRVNENPVLATLHTMWAREHNYIEDKLYALNSQWSGERLFQESRRIVIAMLQHIVYKEFLVELLGPGLMTNFNLWVKEEGYGTGYEPQMIPNLSIEFVTAASRYGHTMIPAIIRRMHNSQFNDDLYLTQTLFNPEQLFNTAMGGVDGFALGAAEQGAQAVGCRASTQLSNHLFTSSPPSGPGGDLFAINVQRGRDHGIAGYNAYRSSAGLNTAADFNGFAPQIPYKLIAKIKSLYRDVDDVDLYTGGFAESHLPDAAVGPTFGHILAEGYRRLKYGDRFFYDRIDAGFTLDQLNVIRTQTFKHLLCRNGDNIQTLSDNVFRLQSTGNRQVKCDSLQQLDLSAWKESL